jgi:hypothetical protein
MVSVRQQHDAGHPNILQHSNSNTQQKIQDGHVSLDNSRHDMKQLTAALPGGAPNDCHNIRNFINGGSISTIRQTSSIISTKAKNWRNVPSVHNNYRNVILQISFLPWCYLLFITGTALLSWTVQVQADVSLLSTPSRMLPPVLHKNPMMMSARTGNNNGAGLLLTKDSSNPLERRFTGSTAANPNKGSNIVCVERGGAVTAANNKIQETSNEAVGNLKSYLKEQEQHAELYYNDVDDDNDATVTATVTVEEPIDDELVIQETRHLLNVKLHNVLTGQRATEFARQHRRSSAGQDNGNGIDGGFTSGSVFSTHGRSTGTTSLTITPTEKQDLTEGEGIGGVLYVLKEIELEDELQTPSLLRLSVRALHLSWNFAPCYFTCGLAYLSTSFRNKVWYGMVANCLAKSGPAFIKWGELQSWMQSVVPSCCCPFPYTQCSTGPRRAFAWVYSRCFIGIF